MIEIDAQPTTNPLDVETALPSSIVRNWPDAMWGQRNDKHIAPSGHVYLCTTGILAETEGFDWGEPDYHWSNGEAIWGGEVDSDAARWVAKTHNLTMDQMKEIMRANDMFGKEAAADLLASWGL